MSSPLEDLVPIQEPGKNPTDIEKLRCTEEYYPELLQQFRGAERYQKMLQDLEIVLGPLKKEDVGDYIDSSPPPPDLIDSSDVESDTGSIDSIQRNANFVALIVYPDTICDV